MYTEADVTLTDRVDAHFGSYAAEHEFYSFTGWIAVTIFLVEAMVLNVVVLFCCYKAFKKHLWEIQEAITAWWRRETPCGRAAAFRRQQRPEYVEMKNMWKEEERAIQAADGSWKDKNPDLITDETHGGVQHARKIKTRVGENTTTQDETEITIAATAGEPRGHEQREVLQEANGRIEKPKVRVPVKKSLSVLPEDTCVDGSVNTFVSIHDKRSQLASLHMKRARNISIKNVSRDLNCGGANGHPQEVETSALYEPVNFGGNVEIYV